MPGRLAGKRALVTFADVYMGPVIAERFDAERAEVVTDTSPLADTAAVNALVAEAGQIDILVANTAEAPHSTAVEAIDDDEWAALFDKLTHPLMRIVRAIAPQMKARQRGKVIAVTSAAPRRGIPKVAAYCVARGAQNAFIRAVGLELARYNVQVNAITRNYVANDVLLPRRPDHHGALPAAPGPHGAHQAHSARGGDGGTGRLPGRRALHPHRGAGHPLLRRLDHDHRLNDRPRDIVARTGAFAAGVTRAAVDSASCPQLGLVPHRRATARAPRATGPRALATLSRSASA